jgi:MFS family permease
MQFTLFAASLVISMLNVIGALAGALMGAFADRIGYRRLIITGLSLMLLGCVAGGYTSNVGVFLTSRFIEGIGFFCTILSAPSLITRIAQPGHLRLILGFWGTFMPTGIAVMLFLSPYVVARVGWRGLWFLNGLICLAVLILFVLSTAHLPQIRKTGTQHANNLAGNVKIVLTTPGPVLLALCYFCYAGQWMALMSFLPTFFIEQVGMGNEGASLWTALAVVVNIPGNIVGGFLSQKNVPRWAVLSLVFIVVTAFTVGVYFRATPLVVRLLLCLGYSFVAGLIPGTLLAAVPFHSPGKAYIGAVNGLLMQGSNMGTLLMAPALAAAVGIFGGWHGAPWVLVAAGLIGLYASVAVGRHEKSLGVGLRQAGNLKE